MWISSSLKRFSIEQSSPNCLVKSLSYLLLTQSPSYQRAVKQTFLMYDLRVMIKSIVELTKIICSYFVNLWLLRYFLTLLCYKSLSNGEVFVNFASLLIFSNANLTFSLLPNRAAPLLHFSNFLFYFCLCLNIIH